MKEVVSFSCVTKRYHRQVIFNQINLRFYAGEIVSLFAPSGVGKTTLIKIMMGLIRPNQGKVSVLGKKLPCRSILNKIGYMEQGDALYNELTAQDNMEYFANMYGLMGNKLAHRIRDILEFLQLSGNVHKPISTFSGGMKRRLSLGITLLHDPDLLILDEPTVGIDPSLRKLFWQRFHTLKQEGKALVVSTHLMDEIEQTDRVCMIGEQRILACDTPENLKKESNCCNMDDVYIFYKNKVQAL